MDIKNKGDLIQAFVNKSEEVQRLNDQLGAADSQLSDLYEAIATDENLMELVHAGGITTAGGELIIFNNSSEELVICKSVSSYTIKDELNAEQLGIVNGYKPVSDVWFNAAKKELEYSETTLEKLLDQIGEEGCKLSEEQLKTLTEAEGRGNE